MTPIANCKVEFTFQCPKLWSKLKKTKDSDIRFCDVRDHPAEPEVINHE